RLATLGPHSVVRHPGYIGGTLAIGRAISCALIRGSWLIKYMGIGEIWSIFGWTWGAFPVLIIYFIRRMTMENDLLQEASGEE
ncbi:hypothetical protein BD779DRAFT_1445185, partial [Infundibulicybe gibba]